MKLNIIMLLSLSLFFVSCGEEPEAPVPTLSQNDKDMGKSINPDLNRTLNNINSKKVENSISDENVMIGEANLSEIGNDGLITSNTAKANFTEIPPTLIEENIEYINTQFESIYFDFDRFSIKETMLLIVNKNLQLMNSPQVVGNEIIVEGNCDEWGTDEYNYALGLKRAQIIKETFISEGVNESRIKVISYGESNPICLEQEDNCWAKNRRVDFKLEE